MNKFNTKIHPSNNRRENDRNRIADILEKDKKRIGLQKRLGAAAITGLLTIGGAGATGYNVIQNNTESSSEDNNETGIHSIDVSNFDTYDSPIDGDQIIVNIHEDARIRKDPKVPSHSEAPNLLHESDRNHRIYIEYEVSEQASIPIAHHQSFNDLDWVGIPKETLPEELQEKAKWDKDDLVWISSEKASVYVSDSENDEPPTEVS